LDEFGEERRFDKEHTLLYVIDAQWARMGCIFFGWLTPELSRRRASKVW